MSIELGQLKSILETAKKLQDAERKSPGILESLINRYNQISQGIDDSSNLPQIPSFDAASDAGYTRVNLSSHGDKKLVDLITYLEGYVNAHTPIPPTVVEGWSGKKIWGLIVFVVTTYASTCFGLYSLGKDIGQTNADPICKKKSDSLQVELKASLNNLSLSQDSLLNIRETLQNEKNKNVELLEKFNQITVLSDSLKEQVSFTTHENDSLKKESYDSMLLYGELKKTRDSLNKCLNR